MVWLPAFLGRSHVLGTGQVGTVLALIIGVAGGLGTYLGGMLADRLGKRDIRWSMWIVALKLVMGIPFTIAAYLAANTTLALALLLVPGMLLGLFLGPTFAQVQGLVKPRMRAVAASLLLFAANLIGLGLGPQTVGILSDLLHPAYGPDSLRYALLLVSPLGLWGALHYYLAGRTLGRDLVRAGEGFA